MPTIDHLRALGREIDRQRINRGIPTAKALAKAAGISHQRLSEIITGYRHPTRGFTIPTDDVLERLAAALDVPVSRLHALLGRFPDFPYPMFQNVDTLNHAEAYDRLPEYGRKIMREVMGRVQEIVKTVETDGLQ